MKIKTKPGTKHRLREGLERKEGCIYFELGAGKSQLAAQIVEQLRNGADLHFEEPDR